MSFLLTINEYFDKIWHEIGDKQIDKDRKSLSSDEIKLLWSIFGQSFYDSLELIDQERVFLLNSKSGRKLFRIDHLDGNHFLQSFCLTHVNYCTCSHFKYSGIGKNEFILCKHLIASRLSSALNCAKIINISDEEMKNLFKQNFN